MAAACAMCHGTNGRTAPARRCRASPGARRDEHRATRWRSSRTGKRPATIMHQIAKGYSDAEIAALAEYFSPADARGGHHENATQAIPEGRRGRGVAGRARRVRHERARARQGARRGRVGGGYGGATAAQAHPPARPVDRGRAGRAQRSVRLVPDLQHGAGRLSSHGRHHARRTRGLARHGVRVVRDTATAIDMEKKQVRLARGDPLALRPRRWCRPAWTSCGRRCPRWASADAQAGVLHAWKAGPQTAALRRQLEAMRDGGVYVLSVPRGALSLPAGPVRARLPGCGVLQGDKPRSKVLLLDENADVTSKGPLFKKAWAELYRGIIEYRGNSKVADVDLRGQHGEAGVRRREGRRAQRDAADEGRQHRRALHHRQPPLVRGRLAHLRVEGGEGRARPGRLAADRPRDAQVGQHGQRPRQGRARRRSWRCSTTRRPTRRPRSSTPATAWFRTSWPST